MKQDNLDSLTAQARATQLKVPIGLLNDLSLSTSVEEVLDVYARWSGLIIAADRCTVALAESETHLKLHAIDGNKVIPAGVLMPIEGTLIGRVYATRIPEHCIHIARSADLDCQKLGAGGLEVVFDAPLVVGDRCFGVLAVALGDADRFKEEDFVTLQVLARCLATYLLLLEQMESLNEIAITDPLTGTYNRRQFAQNADEIWQDWTQDRRPFALLFLDLDHFKQINDSFGHDGGDAVLKEVATRIQTCIRRDDILIRMGGEEFAVLMPDAVADCATKLAERLRQAINSSPVTHGGSEILVSTSIGIAIPTDADTDFKALSRRADTALYQAKKDGRDRVVTA